MIVEKSIIFMKYRAVAAGILAASLLSSPVSSFAVAKKFSDVPSWAQQSVDYLVGKRRLMESQMERFLHLKQ